MPTAQIEDELIKRSHAKLTGLIERLALPRTTGRVEAGNTKAEILRVAEEEHADLIVLGVREIHTLAHAATRVERATAYEVVAHAPCPVLTVRMA